MGPARDKARSYLHTPTMSCAGTKERGRKRDHLGYARSEQWMLYNAWRPLKDFLLRNTFVPGDNDSYTSLLASCAGAPALPPVYRATSLLLAVLLAVVVPCAFRH